MNLLFTYPETIVDGEGIRYSIYLAGCRHHCRGCQNPESWNPSAGTPLTPEKIEKMICEINANPLLDGITFSGGDPLYEAIRADVTALAKEIKERYPKKDIWVYTGYEWESVCDLELMDYTDVVVDGRFILAQRDVTLEWKGSPNQRVIDVKKTRARGEVVLFGEK